MLASPLVWEAAAQPSSWLLACPLQTPVARHLSLRPLRSPGGSGLGVSLNGKPVQLNPETPIFKATVARRHGMEGRKGEALLSGGSQLIGGTAMLTTRSARPVFKYSSLQFSLPTESFPSVAYPKTRQTTSFLGSCFLSSRPLISLFTFTSKHLIEQVTQTVLALASPSAPQSATPHSVLCRHSDSPRQGHQPPPCLLSCWCLFDSAVPLALLDPSVLWSLQNPSFFPGCSYRLAVQAPPPLSSLGTLQ